MYFCIITTSLKHTLDVLPGVVYVGSSGCSRSPTALGGACLPRGREPVQTLGCRMGSNKYPSCCWPETTETPSSIAAPESETESNSGCCQFSSGYWYTSCCLKSLYNKKVNTIQSERHISSQWQKNDCVLIFFMGVFIHSKYREPLSQYLWKIRTFSWFWLFLQLYWTVPDRFTAVCVNLWSKARS